MADTLFEQVGKARRTLHSILSYRGYDMSGYRQSLSDAELIKSMDDGSILPERIRVVNPNTKEVCYVYFLTKHGRNENSKYARSLENFLGNVFQHEILDQEETTPRHLVTLICVFMQPIKSSHQAKCDARSAESGVFIQLFTIDDLRFDIMTHELVPKHERLPESFFETIKSQYQIVSKNALKCIKIQDPVARYIGLRKGEICRITAPSQKTLTTTSYRLCI